MTNPLHDPKIEARRRALMDARSVALKNRDWAAMNEITKRLIKLPLKTTKGYNYGAP